MWANLIGETMDGSPLNPKAQESERNLAAVALSKPGMSKGGKARASSPSAIRFGNIKSSHWDRRGSIG